jgi:hypothetical protein
MVLKNILSEDKIGQPLFWFNDADLDFYHQLVIYPVTTP